MFFKKQCLYLYWHCEVHVVSEPVYNTRGQCGGVEILKQDLNITMGFTHNNITVIIMLIKYFVNYETIKKLIRKL